MSIAKERLMMSVDGYFALEAASPSIRYEYLDGYAYLREEHTLKQMLEAASPGLRYEYLDGQIVMMSGGAVIHSFIASNINIFLGQALRDAACFVFNADVRIKLSDTRYVYPDVAVSCTGWPKDPQNLDTPTVVVEVLSPGTIDYDRGEKLQRYRECPSLQAILFVFQDQPLVEVYRRQSEDIWTIQTYSMDDHIVLDAIDVTMPVAEIYRRVEFTS